MNECKGHDHDSDTHPCSGEKEFLSKTAEEIDRIFSEELDRLRDELIGQRIDITQGEGRKTYILAVRKLTERFK